MKRFLENLRVALQTRRATASVQRALEPLEPRLLLSADLPFDTQIVTEAWNDPKLEFETSAAEAIALERSARDTSNAPAPLDATTLRVLSGEPEQNVREPQDQRNELIIIDSSLDDAERLLDELNLDPHTAHTVVYLKPGDDGIDQISSILTGFSNLDALHLFSHGNEQGLSIGGSSLDQNSLEKRDTAIANWGQAFNKDGDILLYGCDLGSSVDGRNLIANLAAITGTDVAASDDRTGASSLGGDWELELRAGTIQSTVLSVTADAWSHVMALIAEESFDYAAAAGGLSGQNGGSGWATAWTDVGNDMDTVASGLTDPSGTLSSSGGAAQISPPFLNLVNQYRDLNHTLGADGTTAWASFLLQPDDTGSLHYAGLRFGDSSVVAGYYEGDYRLWNYGPANTVSSGVSAVSGETIFIVLKMEFHAGADTISMYLNPTPGESEPSSAAVAVKSDSDLGSFTQIGLSGGLSSNDALLDELRFGESFADVTPSQGALWISTSDDVGSPSGAPGLDSWTDHQVVQIGGADFALGPGASTGGILSSPFDLGDFGDNKKIKALHYVRGDLTVGSGAADEQFTLRTGDLLIAVDGNASYSGTSTTISVSKEDVFVFRPQSLADYGAGEFHYLLDDPLGAQVRGISLVESAAGVQIGDGPQLAQGTFLLSQSGGGDHDNVYTYLAQTIGDADAGVGATTSTLGKSILIDGEDSGNLTYSDQVQGIHLIESRVEIGGFEFDAGDLLLTLNQDQINPGEGVGGNNLEVMQQDVFRLRLSETVQGPNARSSGTADLIFDGSTLGLTENKQDIDALTLFGGIGNSAPTFSAFSSALGTGLEDSEIELSFADMNAAANAADADGSVDAFVVTSVTTGSLRIGADAASATPWAAGTNDTISATSKAYWTPAQDASGTIGAFTVVARDDGGAESESPVQAQVTVTAVGDTPQVANIATDEDTQTGGIVVDRHVSDGAEVTHFRVSAITGGSLYLADGTTQINDGQFITFAQGQAGLRFTPSLHSDANGSFAVEASENGTSVAAQSATASSTITVNAINDDPLNSGTLPATITVTEDVASSLDLSGINLEDVDAGVNELEVLLSVSSGSITAAAGGVTVSDSGTANVRLRGTLAQLNSYLNNPLNLRYINNTSTSADTLQIRANDLGNSGSGGGADVVLGNVALNVNPVNDPVRWSTTALVFINEIHYQNTGADSNEAVEIAGLAGTDLSGYSLVFYDGATGTQYRSEALSGTIADAGGGYGTVVVNLPAGVFQNASSSPDGLALVDAGGRVLEFLSYGGSFNATDGAANGLRSLDIEVVETDATPAGHSLQRTGSTTEFTWSAASVATFGASNNGQDFSAWANLIDRSVIEEGSLTFSAASGNAITLTDIDAEEGGASDPLLVSISSSHGTLTLGGTTGLSGLTGDGSSTISFSATVAEINAALEGLRYTGDVNYFGSDTINLEANDQGNHGAGGPFIDIAQLNINVTGVGDTPAVNSITTSEDTQSGLIVIDRNANDGDEVSHFRISGITNGTLFLADGITTVAEGSYITFAQGQAGLRFTPSPSSTTSGSFDVEASEDGTSVATQSAKATATVSVTPVGDTPIVNNIATAEDTQSGLIVIDRNANDGDEVSHFRISGITNGALFLADGTTAVAEGSYITVAQGQAGLRFTPISNSNAAGSFDVEASEDGTSVAAQSAKATATISVTPVGDTPIVNNITTAEDTQSGLIVITPNTNDGAEVTHFRISGITNGTLYLADGATATTNGSFITLAQAQAGLRFTPSPNSNSAGGFHVESSEDGTTVAAQSAKASSTVTVTPVGDTPVVNNINTDEDTQSGLIVIDRNDNDGAEVSHFRISGISNGGLFLADGTTAVTEGSYITFAQGQAGLRFTPSVNSNLAGGFDVESSQDGATVAAQSAKASAAISVTAIGDTPVVNNVATVEDSQSGLIVVDRNPADGNEVTHFKVSAITNGSLFLADGLTPVNEGDFLTVATAQAGFRFTPAANTNLAGSFGVEASENGTSVTAQSNIATATISVTPVGDTPTVSNITTNEDTLSGSIVVSRNSDDGNEVTHFKISNIVNGELFLSDGITPITNGDFVSVTQGLTGLRFNPLANSSLTGSFDVESSQDGVTVAAQSAIAQSTVTVNAIGDTPAIAPVATVEDTQSGPIVIQRNLNDGTEVTHFRISSISNGNLYFADGTTAIANGSYISYADAQAGLHFTPAPNSNLSGSFDAAPSLDGTSVNSAAGVAAANITVSPVGDTPLVTSTTVSKNGQSELITIERNANDGDEITHFRISAITNGSLYRANGVTPVADGEFITYSVAQAGLRFVPLIEAVSAGSFLVESSSDGVSVAAQSGAVQSTITLVESKVDQDSNNEPLTSDPPPDSLVDDTFDQDTSDEPAEGSKEQPKSDSDSSQGLQLERQTNPSLTYTPSDSEPVATVQSQVQLDQLIETIRERSEAVAKNSNPSKLTLDALNALWSNEVVPEALVQTERDNNSRSELESLRTVIDQELDQLEDELSQNEQRERLALGAEVLVSTSFSAGYVAWLLRGGMLLSSVLSSMPMWRLIDPLPVFAFMDKRNAADNDDDSLDALIEHGEKQAASKRETATKIKPEINARPE